jgi:hypothetical protein
MLVGNASAFQYGQPAGWWSNTLKLFGNDVVKIHATYGVIKIAADRTHIEIY